MKHCKVLIITFGLLLFMASCSKSPVSKSIDIMDDAIEKIEKTNDPIEALGIFNQMQSDLSVIDAAHRDYKPTESEARQIRDKLNEVMRAYMSKAAGDSKEATEIFNKLLPQ